MAKVDRDAEGANRARVGIEEEISPPVLSMDARSRIAAAVDLTVTQMNKFEGRDGMKPGFSSETDVRVRPTQSELDELGTGYFARPAVNIPLDAAPDARR